MQFNSCCIIVYIRKSGGVDILAIKAYQTPFPMLFINRDTPQIQKMLQLLPQRHPVQIHFPRKNSRLVLIAFQQMLEQQRFQFIMQRVVFRACGHPLRQPFDEGGFQLACSVGE